jgi:hypothetical protein
MASNLEKSTQQAKKIGIGCIILIVVVLLANFIRGLFQEEPLPCNPYPTTATSDFGQLGLLEFNFLKLGEGSNPEYKIETVDGQLPSISKLAYVYKTKVPRHSFTSHDEAVAIADELGFKSEPNATSSTMLQWKEGTKTLNIEKLLKTVSLTTNFKKDEEALANHTILPDAEPYVTTAESILSRAGLLPTDYSGAQTKVTYLKMNQNYEFVRADSSQDANFVRVDLQRPLDYLTPEFINRCTKSEQEQIEENPSAYKKEAYELTDNPEEGMIYMILSGTRGTASLNVLQYTNWEIESTSTYNLVELKDAWESVTNGGGYLTSLYRMNDNPYRDYSPINIVTFYLTDAELAYYSSIEYIEYFQPFYKFTGIATKEGETDPDFNFTYYYPALDYEN